MFHIIIIMHAYVSHHYHKAYLRFTSFIAHLCFTALSYCTSVFHIIIVIHACVSHHYHYAYMCFTLPRCTPTLHIINIMHT